MSNRRLPGKLILAGSCGCLLLAVTGPWFVHAQSQQSPVPQESGAALPSFEVASIKPNHQSGDGMIDTGGPDFNRFTSRNTSLKDLITFTYDMQDFQVSGGPGWIASERFDVEAKVENSQAQQMRKLPSTLAQAQMRLLVQSLLADRFKLSVSRNKKELPVYVLLVAKGGPTLKEVPPSGDDSSYSPPLAPGEYRMITGRVSTLTANASTITTLVKVLSRRLGRQIVDQTGLKATYDFTLQWTSEMADGGPLPVAAGSASSMDTSGVSIFTAIQEQLGLRLKSTKGPVDTLTIDHIEEPTSN